MKTGHFTRTHLSPIRPVFVHTFNVLRLAEKQVFFTRIKEVIKTARYKLLAYIGTWASFININQRLDSLYDQVFNIPCFMEIFYTNLPENVVIYPKS